MSFLVDVTPLKKYPAFRRYFFGQMVSIVGSMFTVVALRYQAYKLGGDSTSTVALLAAVQLIPFVASSVVGGAIADSYDKRKILMITQGLLASCSLVLAFNAQIASPKLWVLFVVSVVLNALIGIDWPTRSATAPTLVDKADTQRGLALMISVFNISGIAGPAVAGFFVKKYLPWLYLLDAVSYLASFIAIVMLPPRPPVGEERRKVSFGTIADGFRYLKTQRTIQSTFAADLGAMIFGVPDALFPAFAEQVFQKTYALGLLQAAPAAGAVLAGLFSGWTHRIRKQGWAVIACICMWGLGIALFGATRSLPLALFGLAIAGGFDAISAIFRSTIVQVSVPDEFRGRLSAIFVAVVRGGPKLGEAESGAAVRVGNAAGFGGLQFAAVSGGLACLAWIALVAVVYPELRHWEAETPRAVESA